MQEASAQFLTSDDTASTPVQAHALREGLSPTVLSLLRLEHGYPSMRFRTLALLALASHRPGLSTGICAQVLDAPKPSITRHARILKTAGMLRVASDREDKRLTRYTATPQGKKLLASLHLAQADAA